MFLDKAKIIIKAGDGGKGVVSFYRDKNTPNGGPDGGDGGNGGNIIFRADSSINTLYNFKFKRKFVAENGNDGGKYHKTGKSGEDLFINVPCGTVIYDAKTNKVIADMHSHGQLFTAYKGGLGGKGNNYFATSTRQAPRFSQTGEICNEKEVVLELKTLADVGLVGFPNVGKSTLLSVISNARPKIANYAFTTLFPNLGVVAYHENSFVVADIPGLIEGASEGIGLGHDFLKHIERVRLIVHLIDIAEVEGRKASSDFEIINNELVKYSDKLASLPQIVVLTKCDLLGSEEFEKKLASFKEEIKPICKKYNKDFDSLEFIPISSITHKNLDILKDVIWKYIEKLPESQPIEIEEHNFDFRDRTSVEIKRADNGNYIVSGGYIDNLIRGIVLSDFVSFAYFQKRLKEDGIIDKLKEKGLKEGDTVQIKDVTFEYTE